MMFLKSCRWRGSVYAALQICVSGMPTTCTSYHVGRPWMFEGKMLRGLTGTPMRRIDFANSVLAEAEPEPLTFANFTTKSLVDEIAASVSCIAASFRERGAAVRPA